MKKIYNQMKRNSILLTAMVTLFYACGETQSAEKKEKPAEAGRPHYDLVSAEPAGLAQTINLPAQLAAYQEVSIFPKVNGYVRSVSVDIGSHVKQGQVLMELEAPELVQASTQAKERFAKSNAEQSISKDNYDRLMQASKTAGAVAPMTLTMAKSKMISDSVLTNAEKANWQMQQTMLGYLRVVAPFDGVITERNVHPGALVSASDKLVKPMLDLKQQDRLRLQVDIPEGIAINLDNKDTVSFYLTAMPGKKMVAHIARKASSISSQLRSERVEMDVINKDGKLSPGMYANVLLFSKANPDALTVPRSAVVTSTERKYVIVVRDGKTVKVDVATGNESADKVEIMGLLKAGEKVLAKPNDEIKDGVAIN
ncbi:MAG: efflux RND transporter periplasmic adaptor subunit [Chitinophagaceae bacterium]